MLGKGLLCDLHIASSSCPHSPKYLEKLSEKGLRSLRFSLTEPRNGTSQPILASLRLPNTRSEYCLYPFSDSFRRCVLGSPYTGSCGAEPRPYTAGFLM